MTKKGFDIMITTYDVGFYGDCENNESDLLEQIAVDVNDRFEWDKNFWIRLAKTLVQHRTANIDYVFFASRTSGFTVGVEIV